MKSLGEALRAIQRALGGELRPDPAGTRLVSGVSELRLRRARGGVVVELVRGGRLRLEITTEASERAVVSAARGLVGAWLRPPRA